MKKIILFSIFILSLFSKAQVKPLYNYCIDGYFEKTEYSTFRIKGKKYFLHSNEINEASSNGLKTELFFTGNDTIFRSKTEDITFFSIYKKRFLFVSYYPKEQKGSSIGFSLRKLLKLDVIDLKNPKRSWHFKFDESQGLSLRGIHKFKPNEGKIIFLYKFSLDTDNNYKSYLSHRY